MLPKPADVGVARFASGVNNGSRFFASGAPKLPYRAEYTGPPAPESLSAPRRYENPFRRPFGAGIFFTASSVNAG